MKCPETQKHVKNIIDGMYKHFQYTIEYFNSMTDMEFKWGLSRLKEDGSRLYIVFTSDSSSIGNEEFINNLASTLNCPRESIVNTVLVWDKEEGVQVQHRLKELEGTRMMDESYIVLDLANSSIYASNSRLEAEASQLGRVASAYVRIGEKESKPYITYGIIAINIMMFVISVFLAVKTFKASGADDRDLTIYSHAVMNIGTETLTMLGAKDNLSIISGQWYRLFTCMFLHGGLIHLAVNMYSLLSLGTLVENLYGKYKYLLVYIASGILASLASFIFSSDVSVGASGAIFGLLGIIFTFAVKERKRIGSGFLMNIISNLLINLYIGMTPPNIDNYAHVGGFLAGTAIGALMSLNKTN